MYSKLIKLSFLQTDPGTGWKTSSAGRLRWYLTTRPSNGPCRIDLQGTFKTGSIKSQRGRYAEKQTANTQTKQSVPKQGICPFNNSCYRIFFSFHSLPHTAGIPHSKRRSHFKHSTLHVSSET